MKSTQEGSSEVSETSTEKTYAMEKFWNEFRLANQNVIRQLMSSNYHLFIRKNGRYIGITESNLITFRELVSSKTRSTRAIVAHKVINTTNQRGAECEFKKSS